MNEAETCAEYIDPALAAAGWGVVEGSRIRREYPITLGRIEGQGRRAKPLTADYVLVYRNTKLAVVEAKAWDDALTEGVAQAKNYAGKLVIRFTYASNGQGIYGIDMKEGTAGQTPRYPTPDELWNQTYIVLMSPINTMIEFKQIIGRGTRLYDGKDYFTIYDFVKAHQHFSDPDWDGEPEDNTTVGSEDDSEALTPRPEPEPMPLADPPSPRPKKIKVKLADGKARAIQHMMVTTFWHPDGTPMSALQFMEMLFGKLPEFFKNESELRALWSAPDTRAKLLQGLSEKGFGSDQLSEIQKIIDAEKSDLFDVLAYIASALPTLSREERATNAKGGISSHFNSKQQAFLDFVLAQYVKVGVDELAQEKLSPLLRLKYNNAIADAKELGKPEEIRIVFASFQKYLYEDVA